MKKKFSLIIPVFDSEKYIRKCILSCTNQDIRPNDYEIIVVNDGSNDDSLNVIKDVAKDFANIVMIDKSNGGAGSARNQGLDLATGKYIWFIDSDDWIESNCLMKIHTILENEQLDALQIGYYQVIKNEICLIDEKYRTTTPVYAPKSYVLPSLFIGGTCLTIFRRDISEENGIRFDHTLQLAEDQLFILSIFNYSKRVKREYLPVYFYLNNSRSLTNNANEEQLCQSITKIASYEFRGTFKEYCDYVIYKQFLLLIDLQINNVKRIYHLMKSISIDRKYNFSYFKGKDKRLLICYSYFGFLFLKTYVFIKMKYRALKSFL